MNMKNNNAGCAVNTPLHLTTTITEKGLNVMDKTILSKQCAYCKSIFYCRENQSPSHFKRQKYCSRSCSTKATKNGAFLPGGGHFNWAGGTHRSANDYKKVLIGSGLYINEHILIMEWYLARKLEEGEVVHHINGIRDDNRLENLELMTESSHGRLHNLGKKHSEKTKERYRKDRAGTNQKERHQQWRNDVTKDAIIKAISDSKTKKQAAKTLGIHPDTLRARMKYYSLNGEI